MDDIQRFPDATDRFEIDGRIAGKLPLMCAPDGCLRCVGD